MTQSNAVEDILTATAYRREDFKNKVEEKAGGALLEYYKAVLARRNGQTRWVQHWESEVNRLLDSELVIALLHSIKGFKDRKKAALEVVDHLHSRDEQYQRAAARVVVRDYGIKKLRDNVAEEDSASFYERVREIVDTHAS